MISSFMNLHYRFAALILGLVCILLVSCGGDSVIPVSEPETDGSVETAAPDTVNYYAAVYVDQPGIDKFFNGSQTALETQLRQIFRDVTSYWNKSNTGKYKFEKYIRFYMRRMEVYNGDAATCRSSINKLNWDSNTDNVFVLLDLIKDYANDSNGGACGGGPGSSSVVTIYPQSGTEERDIRKDDAYKDLYIVLTHELGHYRGVTDMYQYAIDGKNNPVNGVTYATETCIMNNHYCGFWSEYAVKCVNKYIDDIYIEDSNEAFLEMFPKKLVLNVTVDGKAKRGISVKMYGSRAGATNRARDIYPDALDMKTTDSNGQVTWTDTRNIYKPATKPIDDLPYGRWFGLLIEATYGSQKKYEWIPEYKAQLPYFDGEDTYTVTLAF